MAKKAKLLSAYRKIAPITLRLKHCQLRGNDKMFLSKTQMNRVRKSMANGTGSDIKISKTQIRKQAQTGGFLSALILMATSVAKSALPWITKAADPLMTGALSRLSNFGVTKALGGSIFSIPQNKVDQLVQYERLLTQK